jgi:PAS domain S-box-containing protein
MPVEVNTRIMELGERKVLFSIVRDITERKRAEQALKEMNARLQTLIHAIPDMVFFKDVEGRHLLVNKAVMEVLGHSRDEILGKTVLDLMQPGPAAACRISDEQAMQQNTPTHVEEHFPGKDGSTRYYEFVKAPIFDSRNNCMGLVTIGRDITERKWVETELAMHGDQLMLVVEARTRELTEANAQLRKEIAERERMEEELIKVHKLESLGILAGGIAHDFNNLLTAILGNISMAVLDLDPAHPAQRQLSNAERASLRAQDLTQQLLTFSKGGAPVKKATSIGDLIRESAGFALRGSRVRCDISLSADLRLVDADEGQMSQVLHNLLINADQAMPSGGVIAVCAENVDLAAGSATLLAPGAYVKITIQDSGIGIPREHLTKIFDPFFTTKQRGSGLGLSTTYSIIKKHDGSIAVNSSPGGGTLVTILLPASRSSKTDRTPRSATLKSASGRILVMDDEESVRQTTGDALARLGYTVDFAEDGARAVEQYREALRSGRPFDLVIMDLTIPGGMGGLEAIGKLRELDPQVKALVSSGYSNDPVMAEFRNYGFAGVVTKPYRIKELSETVYGLLSGKAVGT